MLRFSFLLILSLLSILTSLNAQKKSKRNTNALINESSPYLLQHAYNPVNWYPWGEEALQKAKDEDKLLLVSIGYASCHWCHVMEEESFQDSTVAQFMNENFVAIKVDREERPDIDQLYMDAFSLISAETGWPLNAIALPDGKPVYAVSYLPKNQWIKTLGIFANGYSNERDKLVNQAEMLTSGIKELSFKNNNNAISEFKRTLPENAFGNIKLVFDKQHGSLKNAPKFPMPVLLDALLQYQHFSNDAEALHMVTNTLNKVALGGLYDHLGGGFARYAVDEQWHVPHFEKMLYDNALLIKLYTKAYQATYNPLYEQVTKQTLQFLIEEMRAKNGLFYSSISAVSEGEEGKYYIWQKSEIDTILQENSKVFNAYYQISESGNWQGGKNILRISPAFYNPAQSKALANARDLLHQKRQLRTAPKIDDKLLTSWNALMISALTHSYQTFGDKEYLEAAKENAGFFENQFKEKGKLLRNYKSGKQIDGFLEDYAYLIKAFIDLYQVSFEESYLITAKTWGQYVIDQFYDETSGLFYNANNNMQTGQDLLKKIALTDHILPAANGVMCKNLQLLGWYFDEAEYHALSKNMLKKAIPSIIENSVSHTSWLPSLIWAVEEPFEVAIVGNEAETYRNNWAAKYLPNVVIFGGSEEGNLPFMQFKLEEDKTSIYVCRNKICKKPVYTIANAMELIK